MHVTKARPTKWAVFFIIGILLMPGCRKPDPDLGLDLLPGDPLDVAAETTPLHAFIFEEERIRTSGLTRNLLGSYLDPQFGTVKAGIVAQLRLGSSNVGAGQDNSGLVADSIVLSLVYDGSTYAYGGLGAQRFEVYEVNEALTVDSLYYSNDHPEVIGEDLVAVRGSRITPRPLSPVEINGVVLSPQLRIKLDKALGQRVLDAFGTPDLVDNNAFLQFFRGVYITVDNGQQVPFQNGILYFDLLNSNTKATLYYRDQLNEPELQRTFDMPITSNSVRYTVVEHDHSQALDGAVITAMGDTTASASTVYVQALGGLRTAVRLPALMDHAGQNKILAKAELIVPVQGTFNPYLRPPNQIFLFRRNADNEEAFLPDQLGGIGAIDGNYRSNEQAYRFNITRYVQAVLNEEIPNNGFEMVAGASGISANRVMLAGPDAEGSRMQLLLTFTTY